MTRNRLLALGYTLHSHATDYLGRKWRYCTRPMGSGPTNYFATMADLARYCGQVEKIREWQR